MRSKLITIRVEPETYEMVRRDAQRDKVSISAFIKRAIDAYFSERKEFQLNTVEVLRRLNDLDRKYLILMNRVNILENHIKDRKEKDEGG